MAPLSTERLELHLAEAAWNRSSNWERRAEGETENCLHQGLPAAPLTLAEAERGGQKLMPKTACGAAEKLEENNCFVLE